MTMQADLVMLAVQEALDTLPHRRPGEPQLIHRTHREEGLIGEDLTSYAQGTTALTRWQDYHNHRRPHSALRYLRPVDYYRGDPKARLADRRQKLQHALAARQEYWTHKGVSYAGRSQGCRAPLC